MKTHNRVFAYTCVMILIPLAIGLNNPQADYFVPYVNVALFLAFVGFSLWGLYKMLRDAFPEAES